MQNQLVYVRIPETAPEKDLFDRVCINYRTGNNVYLVTIKVYD